MAKVEQEDGKFRHLTGYFRLIEKVLLISIPTIGGLFSLGIHIYLRKAFSTEQYLSIFLGLVLACIFLGVPPTRRSSRFHLPLYDVVFAGMGLGIGLFSCLVYQKYLVTGIAYVGPEYVVLGIIYVLLIIEATRRIAGWVLVVLAGIFIFYARFAWLFPAPFSGKGIDWGQLSVYLFLDSNGVLGLPLWVSGGIIFGFIIFGESLLATGGSRLLNDFAMATFGRFRGGPAKMAIAASSFFGTISGSAVSNVAATGVMTIPLMKRTGYRPAIAGAIEATASTGGQLLPPVMGVVAFIIAEFLAIPYSQVAIAAILPAILYYFALFIQVDLEAAKIGLKGLVDDIPSFWPIMKRIWILVPPIVVLVGTLFFLNWQPGLSAVTAFATVLVVSLFTKNTRIGFFQILTILERAGRSLLMIGTIAALAGIVVGIVYITGVGSTFSFFLMKIGAHNLFLMLAATAVLCIILGMGLPTGALYIILAVLIAPAIIEMGIRPLAAHLFIFYFGLMSFLTPPVCIAAYAAASIAHADPMKTGFYAVRLGIGAYIVPFIFVYSPALILEGNLQDVFYVLAKSLAGLGFLSIALSGFLFFKLNPLKRILLMIGALGSLLPNSIQIPFSPRLLSMGGIVLCLIIVCFEYLKKRKQC